jgi:hypothetical protein
VRGVDAAASQYESLVVRLSKSFTLYFNDVIKYRVTNVVKSESLIAAVPLLIDVYVSQCAFHHLTLFKAEEF